MSEERDILIQGLSDKDGQDIEVCEVIKIRGKDVSNETEEFYQYQEAVSSIHLFCEIHQKWHSFGIVIP